MHEVLIYDGIRIHSLQAEDDELLLHVLRSNGFSVYSECGGNGACGKCRVLVKGTGTVTSCLFKIQRSIEIILPEAREAQILSAQHSLSIDLPFKPGDSAKLSLNPYGLAVDLGTTTVVCYFVNLKTGALIETLSILNPQRSYGADVISRIQYASSNPNGTQALQESICSAINSQISKFCSHNQVDQNEIIKITVAGNNTMLHLLIGENPSSMGQAPYTPHFVNWQYRLAADLILNCNPLAQVLILPSVSAFVGADIVAGIGSIKAMDSLNNYLFIDLGTNGELALVTPSTIWCCATAAGPAFEGANLSCGIGGVEGAISEYSSSGYRVIGYEKPIGVCGSGLVDAVTFMLESGYMDSTGQIDHAFEIVNSKSSASGNAITISQQDIREVQLAKSAIASGINILLKKATLTIENIDALFLAGGFGNYLNASNAMKIGLLPMSMNGKVISIGNAAGTGALIALKSELFNDVLDKLLQRTKHIELSEDEDFAIEFAMNMNF